MPLLLLNCGYSDDSHAIYVCSALERRSRYGIRLKAPKFASSKRTLPISAALLNALQAYKPAAAAPSDLPFHIEGYPWCPDAFSKEFSHLVKQAGVMNLRLHDLRHAFASLILQQGSNVKEVASLLGHSTPTLTLSTYTHVIERMGRAAVSGLGRALFEGS